MGFSYNLEITSVELYEDCRLRLAKMGTLVHHSVLLELNVQGYRAEQARKWKNKDK